MTMLVQQASKLQLLAPPLLSDTHIYEPTILQLRHRLRWLKSLHGASKKWRKPTACLHKASPATVIQKVPCPLHCRPA